MKLITGKESKIANIIYRIMVKTKKFESKWINKIKNILFEIGRTDLWYNQHLILNINSKLIYLTNTNNIGMDLYSTPAKGQIIVYFRTSNHKLPIETGRWNNTDIGERQCTVCNQNDFGDEFHNILKCPYFCNQRMNLTKTYH